MKLSELNPFPIYINWEGTYVKLKPFSLRAITWAERFFFMDGIDGYERMNQILRNEEGEDIFFNSVIDIVYFLGYEGFEDVGISSPCVLKKKIAESDEKYEILLKFKIALEETISISFSKHKKEPEQTGGAIFEFIKRRDEQLQNEKETKVNWDRIYIDFYRDGGMTIDQFFDLTPRQINILHRELIYRQSVDHERNLNLHGGKSTFKPKRIAS